MQNVKLCEEYEPPFGLAVLACLLCAPVIYWLAEPLLTQLASSTVRSLIYWLSPLIAAFLTLYLSAWHRELPQFRRIILLAFHSIVIFGCVVAFGIVMVFGLLAMAIGYWFNMHCGL
jgi:hypothetical protein